MLVTRGTQTKSTSRLTDREAPSHNERHGNAVEIRKKTRGEINAIGLEIKITIEHGMQIG